MGSSEDSQHFSVLALNETIRRNLRKTPAERLETLMVALRDTEHRGWWPRIDRHAKEQRLLCSIRQQLLKSSNNTKSSSS